MRSVESIIDVSHKSFRLQFQMLDFTFFSGQARTIIDVTLSTSKVWERIRNWKVTTDVQGSDHLLIQFLITINNVTVRKSRNFNQGDWDLFQRTVEERTPYVPQHWTVQHLELEAEGFVRDINDALDRSHPLKTVKTTVRPFRWWSNELTELKKKGKAAFSLYRKWRSQGCFDILKEAKRTDWQQFCSEASNPKKVVLINKIAKTRVNHTLGILRREDRTMCQSPEESIGMLMEIHFPGSVATPHMPNQNARWCDTEAQEASFITCVLRSFSDGSCYEHHSFYLTNWGFYLPGSQAPTIFVTVYLDRVSHPSPPGGRKEQAC